ncbi:MAG: hypothetical protein Q8M15_15385 [Bacteroidota bacterium]|nr:hypothetical protein [Bacteroidota bacterium]
MKSIFTLITMVVLTQLLNAQPKQPPKPPPAPRTVSKPAGPLPYAMKKDVEEALAGLSSQIRSVSANTSGLRSMISAKDESIDRLVTQMAKVEDVLNSTNFKISMTSDSLDQTRFSVEEFRKNTDTNIKKLEESISMAMMIIWILLGITVLLPVLVFIIMNKKLDNLKSYMNSQNFSIESKLAENLETNSDLMKKEARSQRLYTDTEVNIIKATVSKSLKGEMEKVAEEIIKLREEIRNSGNTDDSSGPE